MSVANTVMMRTVQSDARMHLYEMEFLTWVQAKFLLFPFVAALSGLLLYVGVHWVQEGEVLGVVALSGSSAFWWPLFRLGMEHARRKSPVPQR